MKALACKEERITEEISVAVCEEVDVDLETVARFKIAPFEVLRSTPVARQDAPPSLPWEPGEMTLDLGGDAPRKLRGLLLYQSVGAAVRYLAQRYVPAGASPLDRLVRDLRSRDAFDAWQRLEHALLSPTDPRRAARRGDAGLPVVSREAFLQRTVIVETPDGPYFFLDAIDFPSVAIARKERRRFGGDLIERSELVVARDLDETGARSGWAVWAFDGERAHCTRSVWDLPRDFRDRVEREGRLYCAGDIDPVGPAAQRPVAVLRTPSRRQWRAYAALCAPTARERRQELRDCRLPAALDRPLFVYDSNAPVALPEGLPVISDLSAVCALLARAGDGLLAPNDLACFIDESHLSDDGGHLIACVPDATV